MVIIYNSHVKMSKLGFFLVLVLFTIMIYSSFAKKIPNPYKVLGIK
jgi:hypothetical protein